MLDLNVTQKISEAYGYVAEFSYQIWNKEKIKNDANDAKVKEILDKLSQKKSELYTSASSVLIDYEDSIKKEIKPEDQEEIIETFKPLASIIDRLLQNTDNPALPQDLVEEISEISGRIQKNQQSILKNLSDTDPRREALNKINTPLFSRLEILSDLDSAACAAYTAHPDPKPDSEDRLLASVELDFQKSKYGDSISTSDGVDISILRNQKGIISHYSVARKDGKALNSSDMLKGIIAVRGKDPDVKNKIFKYEFPTIDFQEPHANDITVRLLMSAIKQKVEERAEKSRYGIMNDLRRAHQRLGLDPNNIVFKDSRNQDLRPNSVASVVQKEPVVQEENTDQQKHSRRPSR